MQNSFILLSGVFFFFHHSSHHFTHHHHHHHESKSIITKNQCINCAACSYFAPNTFTRSSKSQHHIVYQQPPTNDHNSRDFIDARAALAACPVSAIRTLTKGEVNHYNKIQLKKKNDIESEIDNLNEYDEDDWKSLGLLPILTKEEEETSKSYGILNEPLPFPRILHGNPYNNVWLLGHHSSKSFGAFPYLVKGCHEQKMISIMVDVPKFTKSAIRAVTSLLPTTDKSSSSSSSSSSSPDYMFLTHVDDTAQHNEWKNEFPSMKRIFHSGDLGIHNWIGDESLEDVEILLDGKSQLERMETRKMNDGKEYFSAVGELVVFSLDGKKKSIQLDGKDLDTNQLGSKILDSMVEFDSDFLILHTPGHSPGSICLLYNDKRRSRQEHNTEDEEDDKRGRLATLFTGDTFAYTTRDGGHMTGFPRYGNDLKVQAATIDCIGQLSSLYDCIASGHGHSRHYDNEVLNDPVREEKRKIDGANEAIDELELHAGI